MKVDKFLWAVLVPSVISIRSAANNPSEAAASDPPDALLFENLSQFSFWELQKRQFGLMGDWTSTGFVKKTPVLSGEKRLRYGSSVDKLRNFYRDDGNDRFSGRWSDKFRLKHINTCTELEFSERFQGVYEVPSDVFELGEQDPESLRESEVPPHLQFMEDRDSFELDIKGLDISQETGSSSADGRFIGEYEIEDASENQLHGFDPYKTVKVRPRDRAQKVQHLKERIATLVDSEEYKRVGSLRRKTVRSLESQVEQIANKAYALTLVSRSTMNTDYVELFAENAVLLSTLKHDHLVQFVETFTLEQMDEYSESLIEARYLVTDFCNSGNLHDHIQKAKYKEEFWETTFIVDALSQILSGLDYLHDNLILHGNIAPKGILLHRNGQNADGDLLFKISDFLFSRKLESSSEFISGQAGGTEVLCMSPEFWALDDHCAEKTMSLPHDIWSVGCILHEMCFFEDIFHYAYVRGRRENSRPNMLAYRMCLYEWVCPEIPTQSSNGIDYSELSSICTKILNREPGRRPTCKDLLAAILDLQADLRGETEKENLCTTCNRRWPLEFAVCPLCACAFGAKYIREYEIDEKPIGEGAFGKVLKGRRSDRQRRVQDLNERIEKLKKMKAFEDPNSPVSQTVASLDAEVKEIENKEYAIKELKKLEDKHRALAEKETDLIKNFKHVNVVRYVGAFMFRDVFYMVMELVNGGDLHELIRKTRESNTVFTKMFIIDSFAQILCGMQYLHDNNILHRDLKPANILIHRLESTDAMQFKVTDFGLAKRMENSYDVAGTQCGTPVYMSPEVFQGKPYSSATDIWSLGCLLFEMCMLARVFKKETISNITSGSIPKISTVSPTGEDWTDLQNLCSKMLNRDNPNQRPSCKELLEEMNMFKNQESSSSIGPGESSSGPVQFGGKEFEINNEGAWSMQSSINNVRDNKTKHTSTKAGVQKFQSESAEWKKWKKNSDGVMEVDGVSSVIPVSPVSSQKDDDWREELPNLSADTSVRQACSTSNNDDSVDLR